MTKVYFRVLTCSYAWAGQREVKGLKAGGGGRAVWIWCSCEGGGGCRSTGSEGLDIAGIERDIYDQRSSAMVLRMIGDARMSSHSFTILRTPSDEALCFVLNAFELPKSRRIPPLGTT